MLLVVVGVPPSAFALRCLSADLLGAFAQDAVVDARVVLVVQVKACEPEQQVGASGVAQREGAVLKQVAQCGLSAFCAGVGVMSW